MTGLASRKRSMHSTRCERVLRISCCIVALILLLVVPAVSADEPLRLRIDQAIAATTPDYAKNAAALSSDAEFLRRVTLDLTGTIPTPDEVRKFLKDTSTTKRQVEVDRLLASPNYAWHMAATELSESTISVPKRER